MLVYQPLSLARHAAQSFVSNRGAADVVQLGPVCRRGVVEVGQVRVLGVIQKVSNPRGFLVLSNS